MARRKKTKAKRPRGTAIEDMEEVYKKYPHSFVFPRGNVGKSITALQRDMRRVMEPFTASHLKAQRKNVLRDFVNVAGVMNVTHFIMFTKTELSNYMRVMRLPRGPTMTFRIVEYTLSSDVVSSLRRHNMEQKQFTHHPLLVMNNFTGTGRHLQLMATMFQNLFPSINVNKVKLQDIRRCVLLNYDSESNTIEFRHYNIRTVPVGASRGVKKLVGAKIPNMAKLDDVSDFLLRPGDLSESEAEQDGPHNEVIVPQDMSARGTIKSAKSAVRLTEIGPRMRLQLVKIEEGICDGEVLHHEFVKKTPAELEALKKQRHRKKSLKEARKKRQADNLQKKEDEKDQQKQKTLEGMRRKAKLSEQPGDGDEDAEDPGTQHGGLYSSEEEANPDIAYYREEVGEDPEPELFPLTKRRAMKRPRPDDRRKPDKRQKTAPSGGPGKNQKKDGGDNKEKERNKKEKPLTEMDKIKMRKQREKKRKEAATKKRANSARRKLGRR